MSLRLLIDEDSQAKLLIDFLRKATHNITTINELQLSGISDDIVLKQAIISNRVLLTKNCRDFELLHQRNPKHPGILAIYESSSTSKNMSFQDIVGAISNLEAANISLENQFISLNPWSY